MIEHNVFLQFRHNATQETIQSVAQALLAMRQHILGHQTRALARKPQLRAAR